MTAMLNLPGAARAAARMAANADNVGHALDSLAIPGFTGDTVLASCAPTITATLLELLPGRLTRKSEYVMRFAGRIYGMAAILAVVAVEADREHRNRVEIEHVDRITDITERYRVQTVMAAIHAETAGTS